MHIGNLMGFLVFAIILSLMFLVVPWEGIKRFSLFGVVSGLGIAFGLLFVMQNWLGLWVFHRVDFFYLGRIPLILSAAWVPTEIIFAYYFSRYQHPLFRLSLILLIPLMVVAIHFIQIMNRSLLYHHWNYAGTYLVSLCVHFGLAFYLKRAYQISKV